MADTPSRETSDAERVEILDRMLTRLALTDDPNLQNLLSKLLPCSISSLSSHSTAVRNKVMEILMHVNKRVKHQMDIGLPLSELWKIFIDSNTAPMVKNFCIVYIEMAFERVCEEEKINMAPVLVSSVSKLSPQHQDLILRLSVKVIGECHSTQINEEVSSKYRLIDDALGIQLFAEFCLQTLLYQPLSPGMGSPAGLSIAQLDRISGKNPPRGDALLMRKLGILNIIETMALNTELVYPIYLAACSDSYAGTIGVENIPPESRVNPVNMSMKARLMSVFCRSILAANSFPSTLQCIFGCIYGSGTTSRLKQLAMEFTVWVFKHARMDQLKLMGPVILNGILRSLDGYSNTKLDAIARDSKTFAFQAIGLLAQRMPELFRDKIDMAVRLFDALKVEDQILRLTIQEATTSLAVAYKGAQATILKELETLLLDNSRAEQSEVRFCAVRWATSIFSLEHCPSRFICMLGAADSKLDISYPIDCREMALDGLFPMKEDWRMVKRKIGLKYPKFGDMLDYICKQQPKLLDSAVEGEGKVLFPSKTYVAMIRFLLNILELQFEKDESTSKPSEFEKSVQTMCLLLEHAMAFEGSVELHATASKALISISSHMPENMASRYSSKLSWIKQLLNHVDSDTRESAARLLGIACSSPSISASSDLILVLVSSISGTKKPRFESYHGSLCAIGYVTAECLLATPTISEILLQRVIKCLVDVVSLENATLASVAMQALGHIGLRASLPALIEESESAGILIVLKERLSKLLSGEDIRAVQKAVVSLGHICVKETILPSVNVALDLIFSLCRSKVEDILFAAGEALSFLWGGVPVTADVILKSNYTSLSLASNFLMGEISLSTSRFMEIEENASNGEYRDTIRDLITRKLFEDLLFSSRKEERCAGTVWLLSLTMYCGHHPKIQKMLPEIQDAFSHLLGEQNDLTQELASQGMSIVYDLGDESMKKDLVNALVGTLTGSGKRKRAIKIAKQAGDALHPHLRLLIPRLVRYQYDPDKNVQDAMGHIWKALVADSKQTIDEHLELIFEDLLAQCGSRLWRSREASCLALADIIQGRKFDQVSKHLKGIWIAAFRAMDDIKETVRNAGDSLCRAVSSLTTRGHIEQSCEHPKGIYWTGYETLKGWPGISTLFVDGTLRLLGYDVAALFCDVSLYTGAGTAIRSHLSDLVCCMLESLSSLEDQRLNYVELHAVNAGINSEKLENLRIAAAKDSPMWETLDLCINVVDTKSLDLLVPRLAQLVRSGVGLNTRVGLANFISLLVQKVGADIKSYTNTLLKLLFQAALEEKSGAAKRAFASACAIVLKYAPFSQAQKFIDDTVFLHTGDRNAQISCAILLKNYTHLAADVLSGFHTSIFPAVFVERFEDDKDVSSLFEELWEENTSTERVTLQLYLGEIVELLNEGITSPSWASKKKSARGIKMLSEVLGDSISSHYTVLLQSLLKEVPGRLWEGKDSILFAIAALCKSCHRAICAQDPTAPSAILSVISSACGKKIKAYRESAFSCLKEVIEAFRSPDFFGVVFPLLYEVLSQIAIPKAVQSPLENDVRTGEMYHWTTRRAGRAAFVGHLPDVVDQAEKLFHIFSVALSPGLPWTVKMSVFSSIKELCSKFQQLAITSQETPKVAGAEFLYNELLFRLAPRVLECISTIKIAQVHITASECLLEMINLFKAAPLPSKDLEFKGELIHLCDVEKNEQAKTTLKMCINILESLEQDPMSTN
ncbi:hypothetical protein Sjap_012938 [Stephania japonica]|uniref:ARM repeat superfamily protein n=1 Tax=Stephania japonica TaxID=461633 RepID=A0AAP0IX13_9MAGN